MCTAEKQNIIREISFFSKHLDRKKWNKEANYDFDFEYPDVMFLLYMNYRKTLWACMQASDWILYLKP